MGDDEVEEERESRSMQEQVQNFQLNSYFRLYHAIDGMEKQKISVLRLGTVNLSARHEKSNCKAALVHRGRSME
jgi:hypothetical protein